MYTRDEVKAITDKIFNMAKGADAVEVDLTGSERSGTRWANSTITVNLVQFDRQLTITVRIGQKTASVTTRDFSDAALQASVDEAIADAKGRPDSPNLPELLGAQTYLPVDAALPSGVNFGPRERALMVKESIDICEKRGVLGAGYIPKMYQTNCTANTKGLFAYYSYAEAGFILTCRMADGSGSGWAGITGIKDISMIKAGELTTVAADKALRSRKPKALEPGRYTVILEPRANARFLSLMTGIFNQGGGQGGPGGGGGGGGFGGGQNQFMRDKKPGDKIFSDLFTLKSDVGNHVAASDADDGRQHARGAGHLGGKGHPQESRRRSERPARDRQHEHGAGRQRSVDRRHDLADAPRAARDVLLVHPRRRQRDAAEHRHDARRAVPHRERQDRLAGPELPVEHVAARRLQQPLAGRQSRCRCTPASPTTAAALRSCRPSASRTSI